MEYGQIWTRRQDVGGVAGSARIRFGFPGKFWEWNARLILCGPFVGGAYIDTDPTPSRKVLKTKSNVTAGNTAGGWRAWAGAGMGGGHGYGRGGRRGDRSGQHQQRQRAMGLHPGDLQSPRDVVGSYSQVGATLGNIGLQIGGAAFLSYMRLTIN